MYILLFCTFFLLGNVAYAQLPQFDDFESNFGNWNDGGGNCRRDNNTFLNGDYNIRVRNGSGSSNMTSDPINLTSYNGVTLEFLYYTRGLENNENFIVEYNDGGGSYVEIANFRRGTEFANNNTEYSASLELLSTDYTFSTNSTFRIRCDANENDDRVYIDDINITEIIAPANDSCFTPVVLTPGTSCNPVTGTTVNATQFQTGCTGTANDDVWYMFVATTTSHTITVEADTINDIVFEVFVGGCGATSLVCEDNTFGSDTESTTLSGLIIGRIYRVRVYSYSSNTSNSGTFSICVLETSSIPPPSNDSCPSPVWLTPGFVCNPVTGTTVGGTQSSTGCTGTADDDVWYAFVATRSEHTIVVDAGSINDIVFEVFVGGCAGTTVVCENNTTGSSTESATLIALNVGTVYRVRIYSQSSNISDSGTFSICVLESCQPSTDLGTASLACPSVNVGELGLIGSTIDLNCSSDSITLEATYLELGDTSSYAVESITYAPPYQFGCLENPISVNTDDIWSPVVNLPFDFCFYGNTYNSCVIGSNGVISFDTTLANSYAGWFIANNIPNIVNSDAGYFGPSVYGVHHDVDPSVGGEIGYQLITLDTGCQALVTAWDEVPMYADNSILYSGMMVFYEDTNVIEIYIREKRIDGTWNSGNATVGLQNTSTEGITAPGRNSLDTDWDVTDEAWRFTPNGASITDLKWYENSVSASNEIIDPDNDGQIEINPLETTTYIAEVTYDLCNGGTITESDATIVTVTGQKTWNGSQSQAWDNPNNWTPVGVPLPTNCVTIPVTGNNPILTDTIDGDGLTLSINNGAVLTQESNSTLTIVEDISLNTGGAYNLEDSASLIQIDDVLNIIDGTFTMDRTTNMRLNDYVYWSSPVTSFNIENVSSGTPNGFKYQWLPFVNRPVGVPGPLNYGEWSSYNTGAMAIGKGYIIKGPDGHSPTPSPFTATFSGNPNNGEIIQPIERSTYTGADYSYQPYAGGDFLLVTSDDDNWNLIGNPYPSAINAVDFLTLPTNSNIDGVVYLWTHGTDIGTGNSDPFYEDYVYNYNVADYIAYNSSGTSTPSGFNGNIGAGQGFFVLMTDAGSATESVTFNNSMRSSAYANDQFYRNSNTSDTNDKNRIWLDYISPNGSTNTTLIAYVEGATNDADRMFDAINSKGFGLNLYSLIDDKTYLIQGRQLPFEDSDRVPIGINITESGIQTLALNTIEGLFNASENDIFIEDLENGIIHNLKNSPYVFNSETGIINTRFVLRYNTSSLGVDDFDTATGIKVFEDNEHIIIKSPYESIASVEVFDILGRSLFSNTAIHLNRFTINSLKQEQRVLFLKIILAGGKQKTAKLIF